MTAREMMRAVILFGQLFVSVLSVAYTGVKVFFFERPNCDGKPNVEIEYKIKH